MSAGARRMHIHMSTCIMFLSFWAGIVSGQESRSRLPERLDVPGQSRIEEPETKRVPNASEREAQQRLRFVAPEVLESVIDDEHYVLGPHDVLAIMILVGEVRLEQLPVLPEGVVLVPNVGAVPAAGRSLREFRQALHEALSQRYQNFELYCHLAEARQFRVYVTGEVQTPGTLVARPYERVSDLIERAAGFTESASRRRIEVRDLQGQLLREVDLGSFYLLGKVEANPHLDAGQMVFVPAMTRKIEIHGEVIRPGIYELRDGDTLEVLLGLAGGPTPQADLNQISVDSIDESGEIRVQTFDLDRDRPNLDRAVRVAVLSRLLGKRRVFVVLPDDQQYTFYISKDESLKDLVRRTGQLDASTDLASAHLATFDDQGQRKDVAIDLTKVLQGQEDRELRDGDVLSISNVPDYVYVTGYVTRPGRYLYRADWTVNDYVGEAGGPLAGSNMNYAMVRGADGRKLYAGRDATVRQGDSIYIDRSTGGKIASALAIFTNVSALVISIVALSR